MSKYAEEKAKEIRRSIMVFVDKTPVSQVSGKELNIIAQAIDEVIEDCARITENITGFDNNDGTIQNTKNLVCKIIANKIRSMKG